MEFASHTTHTHTHTQHTHNTHTRAHTPDEYSSHHPTLGTLPHHTHANTLLLHKRQPPYPLPLTVEYFTASDGEYDENRVMRLSSSREPPPKKEEEEVASTTKLQLQFEINEVCEP